MDPRFTISLRRFIAVLLMLWLPIQTAGAVIMPFCKHALRAHAVQQIEADAPVGEHCAAHAGQNEAQGTGIDCDQCELCHLACAGFMAPSFAPLDKSARNAAAEGRVVRLHSVSPEPEGRPPMPAFA